MSLPERLAPHVIALAIITGCFVTMASGGDGIAHQALLYTIVGYFGQGALGTFGAAIVSRKTGTKGEV